MKVKTPPNPARRRYDSPKRRQQAGDTRLRILAVAERQFAARGYPAVKMEDIAREARVSLATLYLHFPGRAAVVSALADAITTMPDLDVGLMPADADPIEQVRAGARILAQLNERSWLVTDILRSFKGDDEELARLWARWQEGHLSAVRRGIEALAEGGALRDGVSAAVATDVFYAIAGPEVYRLLVRERGWSSENYGRWLFEMACRELLPPEYAIAEDRRAR
jgi:AcrR family transcriptional regulator